MAVGGISPTAHASGTADLWCSLSPSTVKAAPGKTVSVTITCGNHGPDTSTDGLLIYTYPAGVTLGPLPSGWGEESPGNLGLSPGTLAKGDTIRATFTFRLPASATAGSSLSQKVLALPQGDPNPGNDVASGTVAVAAPAPTVTNSPTTRPTATHRSPTPSASASASAPTSSSATARPPTPTATTPSPTDSATDSPAALPSADAGAPGAGSGPTDHGPNLELMALLVAAALAALVLLLVVAARRRRRGAGRRWSGQPELPGDPG